MQEKQHAPSSPPFVRGYHSFHIQRVAAISYDDRCPVTYLPLHLSQAHLLDEQAIYRRCIFNDSFVLVTEEQDVAPELDVLCGGTGTIRAVLYSIHGDDNGVSTHIGDAYSEESAREVVQRLTFETGHYSRCWEIATDHITDDAIRYLCEMADTRTPTGLLFVAFHIPYCPAIGVKLIATPWTTTNLLHIEGITAEQLRQEHIDKDVPASLVDVLHQAADADVRILILDADAPTLDGLALYQG
ncbi:ABC transporter substrate-binding protein [Pseudomonas sp. P1B16]|nr:ABC transporter substrate-binding protein [Pseudomonas sp. P1B16]WPM29213.1 ABC transporter substrate-binding protein [Pseudomonas sp. P1B16]